MGRGTGKIIVWSGVTLVVGTVILRKAGINVPGFTS
jgi:hypothetical protein